MRVPAWQVAEVNASSREVLVRGELLPDIDVSDLYAGYALVDRLTPIEVPTPDPPCSDRMLCVRCNWPLESCRRSS